VAKRIPKNKMTQKDIDDWNELYDYVKYNILGYDKEQKLSRQQILRLKGLLNGKYIANNNIEDMSDYSFEIVLITFKFCMPDIRRVLHTVKFRDENHKFNYILRIVEDNINTVYLKMKKLDRAKEEAKKQDFSDAVNYENTFKGSENKKKTSKFDDMW
jgi:hypothetical protein